MDKPTIEMMKANYNLAMTQVDERLQLPIQRYVDALEKEKSIADDSIRVLHEAIMSGRVKDETLMFVLIRYMDELDGTITSSLAAIDKELKHE